MNKKEFTRLRKKISSSVEKDIREIKATIKSKEDKFQKEIRGIKALLKSKEEKLEQWESGGEEKDSKRELAIELWSRARANQEWFLDLPYIESLVFSEFDSERLGWLFKDWQYPEEEKNLYQLIHNSLLTEDEMDKVIGVLGKVWDYISSLKMNGEIPLK
jgi:hypothetical protein